MTPTAVQLAVHRSRSSNGGGNTDLKKKNVVSLSAISGIGINGPMASVSTAI